METRYPVGSSFFKLYQNTKAKSILKDLQTYKKHWWQIKWYMITNSTENQNALQCLTEKNLPKSVTIKVEPLSAYLKTQFILTIRAFGNQFQDLRHGLGLRSISDSRRAEFK